MSAGAGSAGAGAGMNSLEAAVERLWPGRGARVEVLGGGITNHNLKVSLGDDTYVLRIAGKDTDLLGIDRQVELAATRAAAALGVGPDVVDFVEPEGWLVTRFIEGDPVPVERMREPDVLHRVAQALRRVHGGPAIAGRFDSFRVVEAYLETAASRGATEPEEFAWAHTIAERIERGRSGAETCLCHNDLLNANFLDDGGIRIVDWEYAGMGDRFFDLANFAINHELDEAARASLLEAYFGEVRDEHVGALDQMRFMSDFREAMWGVVQTAVSELDFDFRAYAAEHFARLRRTAEELGLRDALEE
jgi:thiamine kinase-like enzyme